MATTTMAAKLRSHKNGTGSLGVTGCPLGTVPARARRRHPRRRGDRQLPQQDRELQDPAPCGLRRRLPDDGDGQDPQIRASRRRQTAICRPVASSDGIDAYDFGCLIEQCTLAISKVIRARSAPRSCRPSAKPYRFLPLRSFGSIHSTCLSALVSDRATEAWYHPSIAGKAARH